MEIRGEDTVFPAEICLVSFKCIPAIRSFGGKIDAAI